MRLFRPALWTASLVLLTMVMAVLLPSGCRKKAAEKKQVVLYTSMDEPIIRGIIADFERETGISVVQVSDSEATRSAGIAARLESQMHAPKADVWWSSEVFQTARLASLGCFARFESRNTRTVDPFFRDREWRWAGTALRVRVIAVNPKCPVPVASITDLLNPKLKGMIGMADPATGTTAGHVAVLYQDRDRRAFIRLFQGFRDNEMRVVGGNSVVAEMVASGQLWAGLTDNDDVKAVRDRGGQLKEVIPGMGEGGVVAIPSSIAVVRAGPHPAEAALLADYLSSEAVEKKLIAMGFAKYSVFDRKLPHDVKLISYEAAAKEMREASRTASLTLQGREAELEPTTAPATTTP